MTAELDLAGLKAMLAEATPGEWKAHRVPGHADLSQIVATMPDGSKACVSCDTTDNDAPFIAAVKNSLPKLIQRIEELEEALRQWKCPSCGGKGEYLQRGIGFPAEGVEVPCKVCEGTLLHPLARAALTPNEGR
jgi:hypothetical protein